MACEDISYIKLGQEEGSPSNRYPSALVESFVDFRLNEDKSGSNNIMRPESLPDISVGALNSSKRLT